MIDEHRREKPPEHRPENNQQPEHTEHRPDNYLDPDLAEMYKDSQYLIDADGFRLDPDPAAPTPLIPDPGPRIAFEQAELPVLGVLGNSKARRHKKRAGARIPQPKLVPGKPSCRFSSGFPDLIGNSSARAWK